MMKEREGKGREEGLKSHLIARVRYTHQFSFCLQIQDEDGVYGVVLVAPSVTPFGHINPSFRTFTMDADTMQLLSYTQYTLDLPKANGKQLAMLVLTLTGELVTTDSSNNLLMIRYIDYINCQVSLLWGLN